MTTRIIRLAAGLAAVGLLATACGDDGDDAGAASVESTTLTSEATMTTEATMTSAATRRPRRETTEEADIVDTAIAAGDFTTLVAAVQAAGLEETLARRRPLHGVRPDRRRLRGTARRHRRHTARRPDRRPRRDPHLPRRRR